MTFLNKRYGCGIFLILHDLLILTSYVFHDKMTTFLSRRQNLLCKNILSSNINSKSLGTAIIFRKYYTTNNIYFFTLENTFTTEVPYNTEPRMNKINSS